MKRIVVLFLILLTFVECTPKIPISEQESLKIQGKTHYVSNCTSCHNTNPKLTGSIGPNLLGVKRELLIDRLTNGYKVMPKKPESLGKVGALCAYLECR